MFFLIIVFIFLFLIIYSWLCMVTDAKKLNIPGPFPVPLLGNGHLFFGSSAAFLKSLCSLGDKYGGIYRFYITSNRYVAISDPKYIEALTSSTELLVKGVSYKFLHPWLGQGLLTSSGHRWKLHRKFLTPAFHFNILQNFFVIFLRNEKVLVEKLRTLANGTDIDLFPIIALAALDNVTESIMGVAINAQTNSESEYVKAIGDISDILAYRMRNAFGSEDAIFSLMPLKKVQDKAIATLHKYSRDVIDTRRRELESSNITSLNLDSEHGIKNRHAFLDLLLLADMDGQKIDDESIREEVDTFMFEGHDTTTSGIVFILYCISKNKDVQEKIIKEQRSILSDDIERDPTFSEMQQMKYLELVIKESLRLYPSVPLFERFIDRDTELAGVRVPKNTSVLVNVLHLQRKPEIFENPLEFRPERFEKTLKNPFAWVPFSAGPRNCIGQKFAMLEMKVTVSAVVRHFKILPAFSEEPILGADLVLRSKNGVHIQLKPR